MGECFVSGAAAASKVVGPNEFTLGKWGTDDYGTIFLPEGKVFSDFERIDGWGVAESTSDSWSIAIYKTNDTTVKRRLRSGAEHTVTVSENATSIPLGNTYYIGKVYGVLK